MSDNIDIATAEVDSANALVASATGVTSSPPGSGGITATDFVPVSGAIEVKKLGYSLHLHIPENFMECRFSYIPREHGSMITRAELDNILMMNKILVGIDEEALDHFAVKAAAGIQHTGILIASGTPPVDGIDQHFSEANPAEPEAIVEEEDKENDNPLWSKVNMYASKHNLINVEEGELLGSIIPATTGTPGQNLAGRQIPQEPGKDIKFTIGKNIRVEQEEDGTLLLLATAIGRFCQARGEFSIEETLPIKGNVDFSTGSVNFKGVVSISGDVLDNFDVKAIKGMTIKGNVGKCVLASTGDISFNGMDGEGEGRIMCGGTLRARFIHDVTIVCSGDIIVEIEIHNCIVKTLGRIIVDKDTITGGSYIVRGGVDTNKLGSPAARHTNLLVGIDYRYMEELQKLLEEFTALQTKIGEACSLEETVKIRKLASKKADDIEALRIKTLIPENAKICVRKKLYENTRITLGNARRTITSQLTGPMTIVEDVSNMRLLFMSSTGKEILPAIQEETPGDPHEPGRSSSD
jgi:uncharacterized protein (DUF342 family)